jgi:hypothetical protein
MTTGGAPRGAQCLVSPPPAGLHGDPNNGGLKFASSTAEALAGIVGLSGAALPPCTQIEVTKITLKDSDGLAFALLGNGTR